MEIFKLDLKIMQEIQEFDEDVNGGSSFPAANGEG
jgi:hypothetical protein